MNRFLIRRLSCVLALAFLAGTAATFSSAQDDRPKSKLAVPPKADPDDDVIVPGKKKAPPKADNGDVVVPGKKKAPVGGARSLEGLLKQGNFRYERTEGQDGSVGYKIPVEVQGQTTTVFAHEALLGKQPDGTEFRAVILGAPVAVFPSDYRPTPPLYKAISEFNELVIFGKGLVSPQGVGFVYAFWLRTADVQTLGEGLYIVHTGRLELKKRVRPILEEE